VTVQGRDQRHCRRAAADPGDDGREDVGELGADHQQSFGVGLGRRDLQQRHELAGAGQSVLNQAVVAELEELFDADAGGSQHLHNGPGPEREVFFQADVTALAGDRVVHPDLARRGVRDDGAHEPLSAGGEGLAGAGLAGDVEQHVGRGASLLEAAEQYRKHRQPFPGPGVHPGLELPFGLLPIDLLLTDRAWCDPAGPAGGVFDGPVGQVEVEGPHRGQALPVADPWGGDLRRPAVLAFDHRGLGLQTLLPGVGDLAGQTQRVDAGMVAFHVLPEPLAEVVRERAEAGVVQRRLAFA